MRRQLQGRQAGPQRRLGIAAELACRCGRCGCHMDCHIIKLPPRLGGQQRRAGGAQRLKRLQGRGLDSLVPQLRCGTQVVQRGGCKKGRGIRALRERTR